MTSRTYQLTEGDLVPQLNSILADVQDRLDRAEGTRGNTQTESNLLLNSNPWVTVDFPSNSLTLKGLNDPTRDTTTGLLEFATGVTDAVAGAALLPRQWQEGGVVSPVVHWSKVASASGTVDWELRHRFASMGRDTSSWTEWADGVVGVTDGDTADRHARTDFPDFTLSATTGAVLLWELRRRGALDTYANSAQLYTVSFNLRIDRVGSTTEFAP